MTTIMWNPISDKMVNNSPNIFVVGRPGKGQKFYLDKNGNKVEDKKVEEDE